MAERRGTSFMHDEMGDLHPYAYIIAMGVSIALHLVLAFFASDAHLGFLGVTPRLTTEQKLALRSESAFKVDSVPKDPLEPVRQLPIPAEDPYDVKMENIMLAVPTESPGVVFEPPPSAAELNPGLGAEVKAPAIAETVSSVVPWQPREEIFTVSEKITFTGEEPFQPVLIPEIDRQMFSPDVSFEYDVGAEVRASSSFGTPAYVTPAPPKVDDAKVAGSMQGGAARMPDAIEAGPLASGEKATEFLREIPADVAPAKPIESVLKTTVKVHRPRRGNYEYFQVDIGRKGENVLPPIPRDVLIVQDASASLSEERLRFCRQAFSDVVDRLRPEDRINVLAFNTVNTLCFSNGWRNADSAAKDAAKRFISQMRTEGNTDFYNAMMGVLDLPRDPKRVMIVIVATDGKPTAGDIQRDSEIIGKFSALNDGRVSIFNVGVSKNSNEYLLSMLSFCNRGGAASISSDRFGIPQTIDSIYGTIGNPVLSDISFLFDTGSQAEVSPEMTTHLYLDRPMQLFGRVPAGTKDVVFQARGEAFGKKYDMVFELDLENAEQADRSLIRTWATARMYDFVSEYARTSDPRLFDSMERLGREYDITIPFRKRMF